MTLTDSKLDLRMPLFLSIVAMLFTMPSDAAAQDDLYACYTPSGVIYLVNPPDDPGRDPKLKDECTGKKHVLFHWNEAGREGPPGPQGPAGEDGDPAEIETDRRFKLYGLFYEAGDLVTVTSPLCEDGDFVVGGGADMRGADTDLTMISSYPNADNQWTVVYRNEGGDGTTRIHAWIVCI